MSYSLQFKLLDTGSIVNEPRQLGMAKGLLFWIGKQDTTKINRDIKFNNKHPWNEDEI
jgi:hypothetical protein